MDLSNDAATQAANSLLTATQPTVKRNASFKRLLKLPIWGNDKSGMFTLVYLFISCLNNIYNLKKFNCTKFG